MNLKRFDLEDIFANTAVLVYQLLFIILLVNTNYVRDIYIAVYCVILSIIYFGLYRKDTLIFLLFLSLFCIGIICSIVKESNYYTYLFLFYFLSQFIIVYLYLKTNILNITTYICMFLYLLFIAYSLMSGTYIHEILDSRSGNMVGFYFFVYVILYHILQEKYGKDHSIIPSVLLVILCILMQGRSGIFTSILFFFGVLFYKIRTKALWYKFVIFFILIVVVGIVYFEFEDIWELSLYKLEHSKMNLSGREEIWSHYFLHLKDNVQSLLFGVKETIDPVFMRYDGNFHNSYLTAHSYFGIFFFIYIISFAFVLLFIKKRRIMFLCLLCLLIRIFSDSVLFVGWNDYIFFLLIALTSATPKLYKSNG